MNRLLPLIFFFLASHFLTFAQEKRQLIVSYGGSYLGKNNNTISSANIFIGKTLSKNSNWPAMIVVLAGYEHTLSNCSLLSTQLKIYRDEPFEKNTLRSFVSCKIPVIEINSFTPFPLQKYLQATVGLRYTMTNIDNSIELGLVGNSNKEPSFLGVKFGLSFSYNHAFTYRKKINQLRCPY